MRTQYAMEVGVVQRKTKTFSVDAYLNAANANDNECPLMFYGKYSRFVANLIDTSNGKPVVVNANIPVGEMAYLTKATDIAFEKHLTTHASPNAGEVQSPAYTVRISTGTLKGMTPAQVLLERQNGKDELNNQYKFLKDNLAKYPRNKEQMDAIADASRLLNEGKLKAAATTSSIVVYDASLRPRMRKMREDGMYLVYDIKIVWNIGDESPVNITISNYYAPVMKFDEGRLNVQAGKKDLASVKNIQMNVTASEWLNVVSFMKKNMETFEMLHAKTMLTAAREADAANRKAGQ